MIVATGKILIGGRMRPAEDHATEQWMDARLIPESEVPTHVLQQLEPKG